MPVVLEISFGGITVHVYFKDHHPPHVHARAAGAEASFNILTLEVMAYDGFDARTLRRIQRELELNRDVLLAKWEEFNED